MLPSSFQASGPWCFPGKDDASPGRVAAFPSRPLGQPGILDGPVPRKARPARVSSLSPEPRGETSDKQANKRTGVTVGSIQSYSLPRLDEV